MKLKLLIILVGILAVLNMAILGLMFTQNNSNSIVEMVTQKEIIQDNKTINISNLESEITKIVKNSSSSVVSIVVKKDLTIYRSDPSGFFKAPVGNVQRKVGGGTAFFITNDGYLLTNKHVVADKSAEYTIITNDGLEYDAEVLAVDSLTDLAVVKIVSDKSFTALEFVSDESTINIGQFAIAVGNALAEFQNSVSIGVISGKNRTIEAVGDKITGLLQTDAAINPGNSGGPLLNLDGKVMGINTAIVKGSEGIGFSIELTQKRIDFILDSVKKYGEIKKPFIGIKYIAINPEIQQKLNIDYDHGIYIFDEPESVVAGSSADKNGISPGDVILEVNNKKLDNNYDLISAIQNKIPGDILNLKVLKKSGDIRFINLELGKVE